VLPPEVTEARGLPELGLAPGYRLGRRLDEGGANEVYLATYPGISGPVVMKFLRRALDADARSSRSSRSQARLVARVRHPQVAATLALGVTPEEVPYLVRGYIAGDPLSARLAPGVAVTPLAAVALVKSIAAALAAVHRAGAIHGELRPTKVFLTRRGEVRVVDFGQWGLAGERRGPGALADKARFCAPELLEGADEIDGRADQFALAAIAHRLLTGTDAFPGDDVAAVLRRVLEGRPAPSAKCALAVTAVFRRGLARTPAGRFATVLDFAAAFEEAVLIAEEITRQVSTTQIVSVAPLATRRGRRARALLLALSLTIGLAWGTGSRPPSRAELRSAWQGARQLAAAAHRALERR
jgi:serine/threonine protein kinase